MKMKKAISLLLCLVMLPGILPVYAFANTEGDEEPTPVCESHAASCKDYVCAVCSAPVSATLEHDMQGGNCSQKAQCQVCGTYGDLKSAVHAFSGGNCSQKAQCQYCGTYGDLKPDVHAFSGGNCSQKEQCQYCGTYGNLKSDVHAFNSTGRCAYCGTLAGALNMTLSATSFTYNGGAHKPAVTVTAGDIVVDPANYFVVYSDNVNAGTATVAIGLNGGGTVSKQFTIAPAVLTVGVNDITINQNQGQPTPSLYINGLVAGQTATISGTPQFTFHTTSGDQTWLDDPVNFMGKYTIKWTNPGACAVVVSGNNTGNYIVHTVTTGTLNVIPTKAYFDMAGVKTYATVDGYAVNMHAMSDKNLDKILDNPNKEGTIELKFKPVSCLNYINTVRIPTALVEAIAEAANDAKSDVKALEVTLINGRGIKLDAKALDSIAEEAEGKFVAIVMVKSNDVKTSEAEALTKAQKKDLGERPAYVFSIISGKEILDEDIEGDIVMKIPYKTRYKETEEGLKVYSIDEDGKRDAMETSYDENTDKVVWNADSLGFYVIEHEAAKK